MFEHSPFGDIFIGPPPIDWPPSTRPPPSPRPPPPPAAAPLPIIGGRGGSILHGALGSAAYSLPRFDPINMIWAVVWTPSRPSASASTRDAWLRVYWRAQIRYMIVEEQIISEKLQSILSIMLWIHNIFMVDFLSVTRTFSGLDSL